MEAAKIIEAVTDAWNGRDKQAFLDLFRPDAEITAPGGFVLSGEQFWHGYQDSFPDNRVVLGTVFGAGDQGVEESTFEGTHTGPLQGADGTEIPPTGRRVSVPFCGLYTFQDGRVATYHLYFDQVELLTQIGVMPEPAA